MRSIHDSMSRRTDGAAFSWMTSDALVCWMNTVQSPVEMPDASTDERIRWLFLSAYSREPSATEIARCRKTLREVATGLDPNSAPLDSWTEVCHALFGVKEFMYVR